MANQSGTIKISVTVTVEHYKAAVRAYTNAQSVSHSCILFQAMRPLVPDLYSIGMVFGSSNHDNYQGNTNSFKHIKLPEVLSNVARVFDHSNRSSISPVVLALLPVTAEIEVPKGA